MTSTLSREKIEELCARLEETADDPLTKARELDDLLTEAAQLLKHLMEENARLQGELDEESAWDGAVAAAGGLDQFDGLAEQWTARLPIRRMIRATTSVFAKWANDDLMNRYHANIENMARQAFVEGAAAGAKAVCANLPEPPRSDQGV